jgi:hypothetical protein|tara:strand:- start:804 stop:1682 length:879 start_codon:yes stop_codon:yes gene_type:complete
MNYIVIYNECLRSKIIYYNFLNNNSDKIKLVVKLPILTKKKNNKTSFYLIKKVMFGGLAITYTIYTFLQTFVYLIVSTIFKSNVEYLCKKKKINFIKSETFPDKSFLKRHITDFNNKEIIFCSTTHILKKKDLNINNIILNFHEADPNKHKGANIYYQLAAKRIKTFQTSIMECDEGIDTGRVVLKSKTKKIFGLSVFKIMLLGYYLQSNLINKIKQLKLKKKYPHIVKNTSGSTYSFPSFALEKEMREKKIRTFKFIDYLFIVKLSCIKDCKLLYNIISRKIMKGKHDTLG